MAVRLSASISSSNRAEVASQDLAPLVDCKTAMAAGEEGHMLLMACLCLDVKILVHLYLG